MVRIRTIALVAISTLGGTTLIASLAGATETVNYTYDAKGRLVKVEHSGSVTNNVVSNYTFDKADNRKNLKVTGAP